MISVVLNRLSKDPMTTPGFGNNSSFERPSPSPASALPASDPSEQRNNVPIICAIAILIALTISGLIIWNDVRSTSQEVPTNGQSSDAAPMTMESETESDADTANDNEGETSSSEEAPQDSSSIADVPPGLTAAGWSDVPEARCQQGEEMVFAAASADDDSHIVICESKDSLFYRGIWSSGAAFGPAKGEGTDFSVAILDPTSGADTGSVLTIRGEHYDIDGKAGDFDVYWPK